MDEHGILDREKKHWHPRKPECIQSNQAFISFHVGLDEFYPALLILLIGMLISLIVLIFEKHVQIRKKSKKDRLAQSRKAVHLPYTE